MRAPDPSERYEDVRRRLVERGYLQGRIERFVLRDLVGPGSAGRGLLRSSAKAAVLGAPILGALLGGTAAALNRPLIGITDAMVLWVYFAALAGMALLVLDLIAATLVGALARRRGVRSSDTLRAGVLVGLPVLAYLVLLWWGRRPSTGYGADLVFLAAAAATTFLVGRLAGIVSLAGIIGRTGQIPERQRRAALILLAILAPAAGVLFLLPAGSAAAETAASPFTPAAPGGRLLFVGVDGLDASLVEALESRGAIPNLLLAMERASVFPKHRPADLEPAQVWTTIVTGMPVEAHGVRGAGGERLPGVDVPLSTETGPLPLFAALRFLLPATTVPVSGAGRRVRTLWEIVGLKEPTLAVGWWASWPAGERFEGERSRWVVTDRVLWKLLAGRPGDRDTTPPALFDRLRDEFPADIEAIRREHDLRFATSSSPEVGKIVWESFLIDAFNWRVALRLHAGASSRAAFVYLPGLDILRRRLEGRAGATGVPALLETQGALEGYVRWLDDLLGPALPGEPGGTAILVADPGRSARPRSEGFVLVAGDVSRPRCVGASVADLDVAPLVLSAVGFPTSAEMSGTVPASCLELPADGPGTIATFGRRHPVAGAVESEYDREMVERLRSLGYLR